MGGSLAVVVAGLVVVGGAGVVAGAVSAWLRRDRPFVPGSHAARDDSARDPLGRALRHGFAGFDVGVWLDQACRLQVGANGTDRDPGNAIGPLILAPLAARVRRTGGQIYHGQSGPFTVMVDILEAEPARQAMAYEVLDEQLRRYAGMLTHVSGGAVVPGPIMIALTGAGVPRHLLAAAPERYAFCDGSFGDVGAWGAPASLVPMVSEHWAWRFGWDGVAEMPIEERHLLRDLVLVAQADGRRVRFFGVPDRPVRVRDAHWRELAAVGVDLLTVQKLGSLARFLRGRGGDGFLDVVSTR